MPSEPTIIPVTGSVPAENYDVVVGHGLLGRLPEMLGERVRRVLVIHPRALRTTGDTVRDELLHTVACKAAIKAGWRTDEKELLALVRQVMENEDLKYCPHGRPIAISLSKKTLEKQFKRS